MKSYLRKSIVVIAIAIIMILKIQNLIYAATVKEATHALTDPIISEPTEVRDMASRILGAAQFITILGGTVVIAAIGLKYMLGSVDEKAVTKKAWLPLIIGICIAMCATSFARIMYNVFEPEIEAKAKVESGYRCSICTKKTTEVEISNLSSGKEWIICKQCKEEGNYVCYECKNLKNGGLNSVVYRETGERHDVCDDCLCRVNR